ncbi:MAG: DUF2807 domain-containing protein [Anaerolineaceae bacterium]|nr:DUF2807 domain-containing protein [Anaerolineaceae bacterium]
MQRRKYFIILVILMELLIMGCQLVSLPSLVRARNTVDGSGNVVEERRAVSGFSGVELATFGDVIIDFGDEESLIIEAEDNLIEYFETDVHAGMLVISTQPFTNLRNTEPVRFYVTMKELYSLHISGSGEIQVPDFETDRFSIDISGSGDITIGRLDTDIFEMDINGSGDVDIEELNAENFDVTINGSGDISIGTGLVEEQNIRINGSGKYRAQDLESPVVDVRIGGSGDVTIWATDSLDVSIYGSGDVYYYGKPQVTSSGTGSGDIISQGDK